MQNLEKKVRNVMFKFLVTKKHVDSIVDAILKRAEEGDDRTIDSLNQSLFILLKRTNKNRC